MESSKIEIIVLVEGIEARSSNTFQARHSYNHDNINFDKFFAPCMEVSGTFSIAKFHEIRQVGESFVAL